MTVPAQVKLETVAVLGVVRAVSAPVVGLHVTVQHGFVDTTLVAAGTLEWV